MANINDKNWLKPDTFDKNFQYNISRRTECSSTKNFNLENSLFLNKSKQSGYGGLLSRQSGVNSLSFKDNNLINLTFKVPNVPGNKLNMSTKSPSRKVQIGHVTNNLKINQKSKMSFLPPPSFISSRKTIHTSRNNRINLRQEVFKKMILLAEGSFAEKREIKSSTPVKALAGLTPKKIHRPKGYLVLPEFRQIGMKLDLATPTSNTTKTPLSARKNVLDSNKENKLNSDLEKLATELETPKAKSPDYAQMLRHCRIYNTEVDLAYGKLRFLEDCFENNVKNIPECQVYDEFCMYQNKKEELYVELKHLEEKLKNSIIAQTQVGKTLKDYVKKRKELFNKRTKLHKEFEEVVKSALEKTQTNERLEAKKEEEEEIKQESPKLRRSLRVSNMEKKKASEKLTPVTRKLKKLDTKSKVIQRGRKFKSP